MWLTITWLFVGGPVSGLVLAWATGPMSWGRTLAWVATCQAIAVLLYLVMLPPPIRSFGKMPTDRDILSVKAGFALGVILAGLVEAGAVTMIWRTFAHG